MKHFAILVGACLVGLAGCVVETGSAGGSAGSTATGGSAGGGVGGATGGTGGATGGAGTGGATGGTGGTGGSDCVSCGVYITDGGTLCEGTSTDLYNAVVDCTCTGACADKCTDNVCAGGDITTDCQNCVIDGAAGCGAEFGECSNDI